VTASRLTVADPGEDPDIPDIMPRIAQIPKLIVSRVPLCSLDAHVTITSLSLNVSVLSYPYASVALVGSRGRWHEVHRGESTTDDGRPCWTRQAPRSAARGISSTTGHSPEFQAKLSARFGPNWPEVLPLMTV
jgi:hypothetical protein